MDKKADDLVDRVAFNVFAPANGQWTSEIDQRGLYENVLLTARFNVWCDPNYHGSDCATYCVATDSVNGGHYTCDSNGQKICNNGYSNPANNCLTREQPSQPHIMYTNED